MLQETQQPASTCLHACSLLWLKVKQCTHSSKFNHEDSRLETNVTTNINLYKHLFVVTIYFYCLKSASFHISNNNQCLCIWYTSDVLERGKNKKMILKRSSLRYKQHVFFDLKKEEIWGTNLRKYRYNYLYIYCLIKENVKK